MFPNGQPSPDHMIVCNQWTTIVLEWVHEQTIVTKASFSLCLATMPQPDSQQISRSTDWLSVDKEQRLQSKFVINKQVTSTQSSSFYNSLQIAIHALTIPNKDEGE
jgi:hypothetical protein